MHDQVREVKEKTDIVAVIGEYVNLKQAGRRFTGLCPFHKEKSPSFTVSPDMQMYKCFGCGEAGDVFTFLEKHEGMEFRDALKFLAGRVGVVLTEPDSKVSRERQLLVEINEAAASFYHYLLKTHVLGAPMRAYLSGRGIEDRTIDTFRLGAAAQSPNALFTYLTQKKKYAPQMIELAGLIYKTERGYLDRFRGRVMFPICDHHGETIAVAGRILPQFDNGKVGKYVNSPETPIYHKGSSLYGIHVTKADMKRADMAVVVEGEMDLLSAWQAGVTNVVAIKGSAFTEGQLTVLSRYVRQTTLALDSDFAGSNAALKGIFLAEKMGMTVKVVQLGDYKDPDEFAKADAKGFIIAVREAIGVWDFIIEFTLSKFDVTTGEGVRNVSRELMPLLAQIEDKVVQARYVQYLAMRLKVPPEAVISQLSQTPQQKLSQTQSLGVYTPEVLDRREMLERRLFAALILEKIDASTEILLDDVSLRDIYQKYLVWSGENKGKPLSEFAVTLEKNYADLLSNIILSQEDDILETSLLKKELSQIVLREKLAAASDEIAAAERANDEERLTLALNKHRDLTAKLAQFTASS